MLDLDSDPGGDLNTDPPGSGSKTLLCLVKKRKEMFYWAIVHNLILALKNSMWFLDLQLRYVGIQSVFILEKLCMINRLTCGVNLSLDLNVALHIDFWYLLLQSNGSFFKQENLTVF